MNVNFPKRYSYGALALAAFLLTFAPGLGDVIGVFDGGRGAGALLGGPDITAVPPSWVFRFALLAAALCYFAVAFARLGDGAVALTRWARDKIGDAWVAGTAGVAAALLAAAFSHFSLGREGHVWDEREFDFQARIFAAGRLTAVAPPTDAAVVVGKTRPPLADVPADNPDGRNNFLVGISEGCRNGKWFTIYMPVWPATLALGELAKAPWLVNPALAFFTTLVLFGLGKRLFGADAALTSVFLYLISPFAAFNNASFFSEPVFLLLLLGATWALTAGAERGGFALNGLGGLLLLLAFGAREYAAAAAGLPLVVYWFLHSRRAGGATRRGIWTGFIAGAALGAAPLLLYNAVTTGNPFVFPRVYAAKTHFGLDLGFIARDMILNTTRRLWVVATDGLGWPLLSLLPALIPLLIKKTPGPVKLLFAMAASTAILFIFPQHKGINYGARYYYGALPALILAGGFGLTSLPSWLAERHALPKGTTAAAVLLLTLGTTLPYYAAVEPIYRNYWGFADGRRPWVTAELAAALASYGVWQGVVFVGPPERCDGPPPHDVNLQNHIIYARDRGPRNAAFAALVPPRPYLRVDYRTFERTGEIEVIELRPERWAPARKGGGPRRP